MTGHPPAAGWRVPAGRAADVWWFDTRDFPAGPAGLAWLDPAETARAAAFRFAADRGRYQAAHVLLRLVLAGYVGAPPGLLRMRAASCPRCGRPSGKPVLAAPGPASAVPPERVPGTNGVPSGATAAPDTLGAGASLTGASLTGASLTGASLTGASLLAGAVEPGGAAAPCFSLAHSGTMVVIAVAGHPVGVDVERGPARCTCSLLGAAHPADRTALAALAEPERHAAILAWWVRAEAVLKCTGEGIAHGLDRNPVLAGWPGGSVAAEGHGYALRTLEAPAGYHAALALAGDGGIDSLAHRGPAGRLTAR